MAAYAFWLAGIIAAIGLLWLVAHRRYFKLIERAQVCREDGSVLPGPPPSFLLGNLAAVYRAPNRLAAYNGFHAAMGEIVQIFWLWRPQISVASYAMARQVLSGHGRSYRKYPITVALLRRLYGLSVVTAEDGQWRRYRAAMKRIFSKNRGRQFQGIGRAHAEILAEEWRQRLAEPGCSRVIDIYPELGVLFLRLLFEAALGRRLEPARADALWQSLNHVLTQSVRPVHSFTSWWHRLPSAGNRRLTEAFASIDACLYEAIESARSAVTSSPAHSASLLDLLVHSGSGLSDVEVRDNLLAVILNGHESTATAASLTLYLLASHPHALQRAEAEVDAAASNHGGGLTEQALEALPYLDGAIEEALRLFPPIVGLNRVSLENQDLQGWPIPAGRAVGIALMPLHRDSRCYGERAEAFLPERYLGSTPLRPWTAPSHGTSADQTPPKAGTTGHPCRSLAFGDGPRRCLGEHFARHAIKEVLATLLSHFAFRVAPGFELALDLKRFALSVSLFPKEGVPMELRARSSTEWGDGAACAAGPFDAEMAQ
jgi:cytochrome P450